jgi:hypothetical protein
MLSNELEPSISASLNALKEWPEEDADLGSIAFMHRGPSGDYRLAFTGGFISEGELRFPEFEFHLRADMFVTALEKLKESDIEDALNEPVTHITQRVSAREKQRRRTH